MIRVDDWRIIRKTYENPNKIQHNKNVVNGNGAIRTMCLM